jgi:hypothetical protein
MLLSIRSSLNDLSSTSVVFTPGKSFFRLSSLAAESKSNSIFPLSRFDLPSYVLTAFKQLVVDVELVTALHIDNFETQLAYTQRNVPAYTDSSLVVRVSILRSRLA